MLTQLLLVWHQAVPALKVTQLPQSSQVAQQAGIFTHRNKDWHQVWPEGHSQRPVLQLKLLGQSVDNV